MIEQDAQTFESSFRFENKFLQTGLENGGNKFWMYIFGLLFLCVGYLVFGGLICLPLLNRALEMGATTEMIANNSNTVFDADLLKIDKMYILLIQFSLFVFAFLGIWIAIRFIHRKKLIHVLNGFSQFRYTHFFFAFAIWGVMLMITLLVSYFSSPDLMVLQFNPSRFVVLLLICLIFYPIQTLTEELVFRGYLLQGLSQITKSGWIPLITTSLLFGLAHMGNPEVQKHGWQMMYIYYAGFAFFLGCITLFDEGLELAYGIHLSNNLISSLMITSPNSVIRTDAIFFTNNEDPTSEVILCFCMILVSFIIFWLKYRWKNTNLLLKLA
jgi:uncharacterized protein